MVLSFEHVWFFKKRLLLERVVEFSVLSIHEKRLFLCRVTSAFDQYAYYEKREETNLVARV